MLRCSTSSSVTPSSREVSHPRARSWDGLDPAGPTRSRTTAAPRRGSALSPSLPPSKHSIWLSRSYFGGCWMRRSQARRRASRPGCTGHPRAPVQPAAGASPRRSSARPEVATPDRARPLVPGHRRLPLRAHLHRLRQELRGSTDKRGLLHLRRLTRALFCPADGPRRASSGKAPSIRQFGAGAT